MQIIDAVIIFLILSFGVSGFKNGFFKQTVLTVGTIAVIILSYYLKDYVANFLSYNLPFFKFTNLEPGLLTLNIILYQMIGFLVMFALLTSVFIVLIKITGVFEKILKFTIILGIPSKLLGFIVGLIEGYAIVFVISFFLNQPAIKINIVDDSNFIPVIVKSSPVLSDISRKMIDTSNEVYNLVKDYSNHKDVNEFNTKSLDIMLKNKIITVDYVQKLQDKNKLNFTGINDILDSYK